MNLKRIAILAPGLLGGSLALALKKNAPAIELSIYARRDSVFEEMKRAGLQASYHTSAHESVKDADLVIFCMTVGAMPSIAQEIRDHLKEGAVITDVGSVKGSIDELMRKSLGNKVHWIGSHPMAGGEKTGFSAATPTLFEGAMTIVTPIPQSDPEAVNTVLQFWQFLGSRTMICSPEDHDLRVGQISHLTHITASALVNAVSPESIEVRGPGFRDTTRVAAGSPTMWTEILLNNKTAILTALEQLQSEVTAIQKHLKSSDTKSIQEWLEKSSSIRSKL